MKARIFASTKPNYVASKQEMDKLGGLAAGICYLPDTIEALLNEPEEKTARRINNTKANGHISPYFHGQLTIELDDVPKIVAMALNNEGLYNTSEKSARYRRMTLQQDEQILYDKWLELFKELITKEYKTKCPQFFTDTRITKLAQENARYLTSVFTPTSLGYSVPYGQLNVLHGLIDKEIGILKAENTDFSLRLAESFKDLNDNLKALGYYDEQLAQNRTNRSLSLIRRDRPLVQSFGDSYTTSYYGSLASLAQAQRHRTLDYSMEMLDKPAFFVPPILEKYPQLAAQWLKDCNCLAKNYPQGMLVKINEQGTVENFILKCKSRMCSMAQLEIDRQTSATLKTMLACLRKDNHPAAKELEPYSHGSRCTFPDFQCDQPCGFPDGVSGERII